VLIGDVDGARSCLSVVTRRRRLTVVVQINATASDRSDPAAGPQRLRAGERHRRIGTCLALGVLAVVVPVVAAPLTGSPGATVGAVVVAAVLCLLAAGTWPSEWGDTERVHHELAWIWRQVRADAETELGWERYAAEAVGDEVELQLICCAPIADRVAGAPSPFSRLAVRRLDAEDVEAAAEAMEQVRGDAAERERRARERHELADMDAASRACDERLSEIDSEAAADLAAREQQLRHEFAEQEAVERRAQAEAVAQALRRL